MLVKLLLLLTAVLWKFVNVNAQTSESVQQVCLPAASVSERLPDFRGLLVGPKGEKGEPGEASARVTSQIHLGDQDEEIMRLREEISGLNTKVRSLLDERYGPCPNIHYEFPQTAHDAYVRYMPRFPHFQRGTFCSWVYVTDFTRNFAVASYASSDRMNNDFLVWITSPTNVALHIHGQAYSLEIDLPIRTWTHICIWFDSSSGKCGSYSNGQHSDTRRYSYAEVIGGGSFMLGQDQDAVGGRLDSNQSFRGSMKNMMIWPRVLTTWEIEGIAFSCTCPKDYAVSMTSDKVQLVRNVIYSVGEVCPTA